MSKKKFTPTQAQRNAADPQHTVWVTANAGSGKTHVLVERVARLLLAGTEPGAILCITYTKAAATEMSARLFTRLGNWAIMDETALVDELTELCSEVPGTERLRDARRLFARALETPGGLKIQTIHAFCEKLLQQFPVEAGMAPGFHVMDDRDTETQISTAFTEVLSKANLSKDEKLAAALANVISHVSSGSFESLIRQFLSNAKGLRNILNTELDDKGYALILKKNLDVPLGATVDLLATEIFSIDRNSYRRHGDILSGVKIHGKHDTAKFLKNVADEPCGLEIFRSLFLTGSLEPRASLISVATKESHPATADFLMAEQQRIVDLLYLHDLLLRIEATSNVFTIAKAVHNRIEINKKRQGHYDFDDLINRTSMLLTASRAAQWVLYKLDADLKHILVDEAQDTSPAQWIIISALAEEFFAGQGGLQKNDRTLFVVGDRKQSIYSFQGADIHALAKARTVLSSRITSAGKSLLEVDLDISYRTTTEILTVVDLVFPPNLPRFLGFDLDDSSENPHQSNRINEQGLFQLWPILEAPLDVAEDRPWDAPVDQEPNQSARRLLARQIAETIKSWIGKRELKPRDRMIEAGDILILFQSRGPLFSMLLSELRKLGVPVAGADRLKLQESIIVQDLLVLLQWLLIPSDDFSLACVLKGPLLDHAVSEDALMQLAIGRGTDSLWSRLQSKPDANVTRLLELQKDARKLAPYEFFADILTKARNTVLKRLGTEAIDASNAFLDQAMAYQMEHGNSLLGFLHWFQSSDTSIKREMEQAAGEVRLMTVHGAKGLEANIVLLADAATVPTGGRNEPVLLNAPNNNNGSTVPLWSLGNLTDAPSLQNWKDNAKMRATAERNRLLYVAMTRACDELHVCGHKSSKTIPSESWYATIKKAIENLSTDQANIASPTAPAEGAGKRDVAPSTLPTWALERPAEEAGKSIYSLTALVEKPEAKVQAKYSRAQRRGTEIHALLHELSNMVEPRREQYTKNWARRLNYTQTEALDLLRVMNSSELEPFFGPNSHGEAEIRGMLPDGREVSGRVDRLNILEHEIFVLDYKTDRNVPDLIENSHPYTHQMALYSTLLEQAYPNRKIKAALLWTQSAKLMWIEPHLLSCPPDQVLAELEPEAP